MGSFSFLAIFVVVILRLFLCRTTFAVVYYIRPSDFLRDNNTTLVSREGRFELGFFTPNTSSNNRYLGIWYKNISVQTVVWVANRCKPINDSSGFLTINNSGNLVLFSGQDNNKNKVVWSTNSSSKQAMKPLVQLLENGNLVMRDENDENTENYLWESFDHPTDTIMPGMKLGCDLKRGLNRRLSSWKSWDDPCNGDFTFGIELDESQDTYPQLITRKGSSKFYRTGPWNGIGFSGSPSLTMDPLLKHMFVYNDFEVYYMYNIKDNSVISRIVMNQTTSVREIMMWIESDRAWWRYGSVPSEKCDKYGICGANSECVVTNNQVCQCLKGFFKPKSEEENRSEGGCVRNKPLLSCGDRVKDEFIRVSGLKMPDTQYTWVNKSMNLEECRAKCLSNCSCMAYTNSDIRGNGSGCLVWFGDLYDIQGFQSSGQGLYIRISASETDNYEKTRTNHK
ncbi:hypothetical protein F8388_023775, partial [Cannabis sativa]